MNKETPLNSTNSASILIAGGSSGLGFSLAKSLICAGENVIILGRNNRKLETALEKLRKLDAVNSVEGFAADVTSENDLNALKNFLSDKQIVSAVTCIGSGRPINSGSLSKDLTESLAVNLLASVQFFETIIEQLASSKNSSFVFTSSIAGMEYIDCPIEYAVAKSSFGALTTHLARIYPSVRINTVAPGNFNSELGVWESRLTSNPDLWNERLKQLSPMGRVADVTEVAKVIQFLVSPDSSFITGSTFIVDGGQTRSW